MENQRLCAGSFFVENDTIYYFGSYTLDIVEGDILDQQLFLAVSKDGQHYTIQSDFNLSPDSSIYKTGKCHPVTKKMVFAWRDPYIFNDPVSRKFYIFICTGAKRWGVPPTVAVASSDNITGPFELLPPATDITVDIEGNSFIPLDEIERVQIIYHNNKYHMLCSCWSYYIHNDFSKLCSSLNQPVTDSTIYILTSDSVTGPYKFELDNPVVINSNKTDLYGIYLIDKKTENDSDNYLLTGWYPDNYSVSVSGEYQVIFDKYNIIVGSK